MTGLILTGLTGSGKTAVAYGLARQIGGEVVNLDRTFTWKHFSLTSGLSDALAEEGVVRHLYEFLEPHEPLVPGADYAVMVGRVASEIGARGKIPIVEGGSPKYFADLYRLNVDKKIFCLTVCLTYPASTDVRAKILRRIDGALAAGAIEEVRENLKKYRDAQFMREGKFAVPLVRYLDGEVDLATAKEEMVQGALDLITYQREEFGRYGDVVWVENEDTLKTVAALRQMLVEANSSDW